MRQRRGSAGTRLAGPALAVGALLGTGACERPLAAPSPSSAPASRGPRSDYAAYGRYPPPPDAPPAAWPDAASARPLASAGCGKPAPRVGVTDARVRVGSQDRAYVLSVPPSYAGTTSLPLVFVLHGGGGTASGARAQLDLEKHANGRALFVYPQAVDGTWDLDADAARNPDVALFDVLLFTIANAHCVDTKRVFVTGFSNGAYMANQLACRRGDKIRGVASHAGGGPYESQGRYDEQGHLVCPGKAVAALVVHGGADAVVAPTEGESSVSHWRFANRCASTSAKAAPVPCELQQGCAQPVVSCRIAGLGHATWREGSAATWAFFDALR